MGFAFSTGGGGGGGGGVPTCQKDTRDVSELSNFDGGKTSGSEGGSYTVHLYPWRNMMSALGGSTVRQIF